MYANIYTYIKILVALLIYYTEERSDLQEDLTMTLIEFLNQPFIMIVFFELQRKMRS